MAYKDLKKQKETTHFYYEKNKIKYKEWARNWRKKNPEKYKEINRKSANKPESIYKKYRLNALTRKISFDISFEDFKMFWGYPCFYCGEMAKGLDRTDNKKGYIFGNIVSCCDVCNYMKGGRISSEEFISQSIKISNYQS